MNGDKRHLDGNMAAGPLGEIFPFEMSMVETMCSSCSQMAPIGAELVYADAPGVVVRCVHCQSVLMRAVHGGGRYWLDMRGSVCLQIADGSQSAQR